MELNFSHQDQFLGTNVNERSACQKGKRVRKVKRKGKDLKGGRGEKRIVGEVNERSGRGRNEREREKEKEKKEGKRNERKKEELNENV